MIADWFILWIVKRMYRHCFNVKYEINIATLSRFLKHSLHKVIVSLLISYMHFFYFELMYWCIIQILDHLNIYIYTYMYTVNWNSLPLTHLGRDEMAGISQKTFAIAFRNFVNEYALILIDVSLTFVPKDPIINIPALTVPATSHYLNQWWLVYRHIYAHSASIS